MSASSASFLDIFNSQSWQGLSDQIYAAGPADVAAALAARQPTLKDFAALISPAAAPFLEEMAQRSHALSTRRFGKTIQMYVPLYLSNECQNICTYCGFSLNNKIARLTLNERQIRKEAEIIKQLGFDHVLLVTGESNKTVGVEYLLNAVGILKSYFSNIAIEVQPLKETEYESLHNAGVHTVLVYQETYEREAYKEYHPKGRKSNFDFRLETPDRIARAGIHKIGLGALLGLEDWRVDAACVAMHLEYLRRKYWQTKYSVSFPRLRPAEGTQEPRFITTERDIVQLICAFRIFDEQLELSLSTRERAEFRDRLVPLGITSMSAGSKTDPGGYANPDQALKQFEISDERSPAAVAEMIKASGYDVVWKDWDNVLQTEAV